MGYETSNVTQLLPKAAWALVGPRFSPYALEVLEKLTTFVLERCLPAESTYHDQMGKNETRWTVVPPIIEELKKEAKALGLWNLFLSKEHYPDVGVPLTNLEYAIMCEVMGYAISLAPEATNCSAPDTGNMEVLARWGTPEQKRKWLDPLLNGEVRSSFSMTEPDVASSDATNISTTITAEGDDIIISGRKWWISSAGDPRLSFHILMGKSDKSATPHKQQSIVIIPSNAKGITLVRPLSVFGYDDAPSGHFEVIYDNVRVPKENLVAGWGRGFEVMQSRMGPGRIHHCMRSIGAATRALDLMLLRATEPKKAAFGKLLADHGVVVANIAQSRMEIDQSRLLVLSAALQIDLVKAKGALKEIGMAKAVVPVLVGNVIDRAVQIHGGEGLCQDTVLAGLWANVRIVRIADGPDDIHIAQVGKVELRTAPGLHARAKQTAVRERSFRLQAGLNPSPLH